MNKTPNATHQQRTFFPIPEFSDVSLAFGAPIEAFFPDRYDLPHVPREHAGAAMELFYEGGKLPDFDPRVDRALATRAMKAWLGSWAPSHEQKEATVGYALWVWSTPAAIDAALAKAAA